MTGAELIKRLLAGSSPRPPYLPILGEIACKLGQVDSVTFRTDAQAQAVAATETAIALRADSVTVGYGSDPQVGADAVKRVRALAGGRGVLACLSEPDVAGVRAYCEAGVDMVVLLSPDQSKPNRFRTIANTCTFYSLPVILIDPTLPDGPKIAERLGLHGAVVSKPSGEEPGIVGGGLAKDSARPSSADPVPPRPTLFFWSFAGEVPADLSPEDLAGLGQRLT